MTDQPMMTLVVEVPLISALCEGENDKFATKFGQVMQGVLFDASASQFGLAQGDIEVLYTTSRSTIATNKKMLKESGAVWGVVPGNKLQELMGGGHAVEQTEQLTDATQATIESLEAADAQSQATADHATQILNSPMGQTGAGENVVPLDPNATQPQVNMGPTPEGFHNLPPAEQQAMVQAHVDAQGGQAAVQAGGHAPLGEVAQPQPQTMAPPAPTQQMAPPAPAAPAAFDVTAIDTTLSQHMHAQAHPTGDPASGVAAGEVMYWQANPAVQGGGSWLTRVQSYAAFGQQPPEMVPPAPAMQMQPGAPQGGAPGQPAIGQPVGPQGPLVQNVAPQTQGFPHQ